MLIITTLKKQISVFTFLTSKCPSYSHDGTKLPRYIIFLIKNAAVGEEIIQVYGMIGTTILH